MLAAKLLPWRSWIFQLCTQPAQGVPSSAPLLVAKPFQESAQDFLSLVLATQLQVSLDILIWSCYFAGDASTGIWPCPRKNNSTHQGFFQSPLGTVSAPIHPLLENPLASFCGLWTWRWISKTTTPWICGQGESFQIYR